MKPPRAMRFVLAMLLCYALPPVFTLSILDSAFSAIGNSSFDDATDGSAGSGLQAVMGESSNNSSGTQADDVFAMLHPHNAGSDSSPILLDGLMEHPGGDRAGGAGADSEIGPNNRALFVMDPVSQSKKKQSKRPQGGQCVMRGHCNYDEARKTYQNCEYHGPPKQLAEARAKTILNRLCPQMLQEFGKDTPLCCDDEQVYTLEKNLGVPEQFFSRCPSCFHNFANMWCHSTCSPVQSNFTHITKTRPVVQSKYFAASTSKDQQKQDHHRAEPARFVSGIKYHISRTFVESTFASCRNVQYPGSNQLAIGLMCGAAGDHCTIPPWLEFLSDPSVNDMVPFPIEFKIINITSSQMSFDLPYEPAIEEEFSPSAVVDGIDGFVKNVGSSSVVGQDYEYGYDYEGGENGGDGAPNVGSAAQLKVKRSVVFLDPNQADNSGEEDMIMVEVWPMSSGVVPCNKAPSDAVAACSCQDCEASCHAVAPYPDITPPLSSSPAALNHSREGCYIAGTMDCVVFVSLLSFGILAFITLIVTGVYCVLYTTESSDDSPRDYPSSPIAGIENGKYNINIISGSSYPVDDSKSGSVWQRAGYWVEYRLEKIFTKWGILCTRHPVLIFMAGLVVSLLCSTGLYFMEVTTDPVKLWSSPNSRGRQEKDFFDENFNPFYRTEQLIVVPTDKSPVLKEDLKNGKMVPWGPVFRKSFIHQVLEFQKAITDIEARMEETKTVTLSDICFKPLEPDNKQCAVFSLPQYFQNSGEQVDAEFKLYDMFVQEDYTSHLKSCFDSPTQVNRGKLKRSCLSAFGAPVMPYVVLGGFEGSDFGNATALVITIIVKNHAQSHMNDQAAAWEKELISFVKNFHSGDFKVYFRAERSIQDEIDRESKSDMSTIVISYSVMFLYISFALGQYSVHNNNLFYLLVNSKIILGFTGVVIVMLSVVSSVGIYSYFGIPATLIIVEVVPFLVLAVGVDNIFIIVQAYQCVKHYKDERLEDRIGRVSGEVIPSMLISSLSEVLCFFLGAMSSMPAVKIFSLYAAMAILFDFFLQITCFLALFTMDIRRQESGRLEVACCLQLEPKRVDNAEGGLLKVMVRDYFTPFLMTKPIRFAVFFIFTAWLFTSVAVINKVPIGLDQKLAMPGDSYVLRYFEAMEKYLKVGPPVYFVVDGELDYADPALQNAVCGSSGCNQNSLYGQIYNAAHYSDKSYVAYPVTSWLDDYFDWLRPGGDPPCCRFQSNDNLTFCPSTNEVDECSSCNVNFKGGRPDSKAFYGHIDDYLSDNPNFKCSKGGHAAYGDALSFSRDNTVKASYFMTYHSVLKTSNDFINALTNTRFISDNVTRAINANLPPGHKPVRVFAYSVFYVFYEQYLTIVQDAASQIVLSLFAIFIVTTIFLGLDPWSGAMIVITISMILLDMCGIMYWWGITFNAVSLVNLVMATGIAVEFCAHIVRAYAVSVLPSREERAKDALANMGSSVLSGITLTKFGGILVLAFSHSQIFQIFYFRMYLSIVFIGATHSLLFLPVLLSFVGPSVNGYRLAKIAEREQGLHMISHRSDTTPPPMQELDMAIGGENNDDNGPPCKVSTPSMGKIYRTNNVRQTSSDYNIDDCTGLASSDNLCERHSSDEDDDDDVVDCDATQHLESQVHPLC